MRDYRKLRAFELADELVLMVYRTTKTFPKEELFGLTSQLRRAAVSIASNIVEGSGRESEAEYVRFLNMAYSSASEVCYQLSLAYRLGYLKDGSYKELSQKSDETARVLNGLNHSLRKGQ
jgi:four helix bundle protein